MILASSASIGAWLADYYALSTLVLLGAGAVVLGQRQPARRLAVCRAASWGLLALLVLVALPSWPRVPLVGRGAEPPSGPTAPASRVVGPTPTVAAAGRPASGDLAAAPGEPAPAVRPAAAPRDWGAWVVRAFLAGVVVAQAWLAIGAWRLAALRRRSRRAPPAAKALLARIVGRAGAPELLVTDALRHPVAAGVARPAIILPSRFLDEPEGRLEAALTHEWNHVRNGDLGLIALSRLLLPALFAHPAYWWLRSRIGDDQEALADAAAAAAGGRLGYAEVLLSWARDAPERSCYAAGGSVALFERPSQIKRRIVMLLDSNFRVETTCPAWWRIATRSVAAAAVVGASLLTLRPAAVADGPQAVPSPSPAPAPGGPMVVSRLLDPDGKPVAGAKVFLSSPRRGMDGGPKVPTLLGETGPDGSFRHPRPAATPFAPAGQVVVASEGFGPALVDGAAKDAPKDVRLVPDDVPIRGRVLDVDGRPVAGARVEVTGVFWLPGENLDEWLKALEREKSAYIVQNSLLRWWANDDLSAFFPPVVAGEDGRFTIRGVGRERIAALLISGPGVETTIQNVATRAMPAVKYPDFPAPQNMGDVTYHGAEFDLVAGPDLVAEGTVTDKDTGAPVAGAVVETTALFGNPLRNHTTTTDARGRYRLAGMPPKTTFGDGQDLLVRGAKGSLYVQTTRSLGEAAPGKPIVVDFQVKRGTRVKGRVVDGATGAGVRGGLDYYILSDNPSLQSYPRYGTIRAGMPIHTDDAGNFDVVVMPGPGVFGARAWGERYRLGAGVGSIAKLKWTDDRRIFGDTQPYHLIPNNYHTVVGIDPKPGDEEIACEIRLDPGRTVKGRIVGPDGEPLAGARIEGLEDFFRTWSREPLPSAEFAALGIAEGATRDLLAYHEGKKLVGALVIGAGEAGPVTLKLGAGGVATGRLVDEGGAPLPDVELTSNIPHDDEAHAAGSLPGPVRTGPDGRFRAEGLVPGRKYTLRTFRSSRLGPMALTVVDALTVAAGETKDLGDVVLKGGD